MKLLASLAIATATFLAATFGLAAPAAADDDDVSVGLKLGPLCVGICIDGGGGHHGRRHRGYRDDNAYYDDGFYAHREDYYHQRYDRRDYAEARQDGYAGYRRNGHHRDYDENDGGDDEDDDGDD